MSLRRWLSRSMIRSNDSDPRSNTAMGTRSGETHVADTPYPIVIIKVQNSSKGRFLSYVCIETTRYGDGENKIRQVLVRAASNA